MVFFWKLRYNLLITDQWILAYQIWCKCHLKNDVFTAGPPTDLVPAVLHHRYSAEHPLRYPTGVSKFPGRVEVKDATHQGEPRGKKLGMYPIIVIEVVCPSREDEPRSSHQTCLWWRPDQGATCTCRMSKQEGSFCVGSTWDHDEWLFGRFR